MGRIRSRPIRSATSILFGSNFAEENLHVVLADGERGRRIDESFKDSPQLSEVSGRLPDDEVSEPEDVEVRKEVSLREGQDPDPRKPHERSAVLKQLVLEPHQPGAEAAEQRLQVALFLSGVLQEALAIDEKERNVRAEQRLERDDPTLRDLRITHLLLEPLPGVVVPNEAYCVERLRHRSRSRPCLAASPRRRRSCSRTVSSPGGERPSCPGSWHAAGDPDLCRPL